MKSTQSKDSFQLKDLSSRQIPEVKEQKAPADSTQSEGFTDVFNEPVEESVEKEEFVDETFEQEEQAGDDFLVFKDDSADDAGRGKDTGRVSRDASPDKGI